MQTQKKIWTYKISKTRVEFLHKVTMKSFAQNNCLQKSGLFIISGSPPAYQTQGFHVEAFRENFNVMSYYAEDSMILKIVTFYSFG